MGDVAAAPVAALGASALLVALAAAALVTHLPIARRTTATRSRRACRRRRAGLRHHRPALRERVRRLGHGAARPGRAARARRPLRRRAAARPRARARHAPFRLDAGRHAAGAGCSRRRRCSLPGPSSAAGARERVDDVVARALRHARGPDGPSGFDIEGSSSRRTRSSRSPLGVLAGLVFRRTVAAMSVTLVVFAATRARRRRVPPPALPRAAAPDRGRADAASAHAGDWVLSDTLVDAGGRHITAAREDLAILHAQQAGIDPHKYLVTLGWRRIDLVPAGRAVLDVPADRGRALRRAGRRAHCRRGLARPPDAGVTRARSTARGCCGSRPAPLPSALSRARPRAASRAVPAAAPALALRLRQPRADESVLRARDERQRRRRRAASASTCEWTGSVSSDVGEMVKAMRRAIATDGRRDRRLDHRPDRVRRADRARARARHPGRLLQRRRRQGEQAARLHRPGHLPVRPRVRRPHRRASSRAATCSSSSRRRASRTSSRASTARSTRSATRASRSASTSSRPASTSKDERKKIEATYLANRGLRGLFAVDAGSTQGVAEVMRKHRLHARGVRAGGYDLLPRRCARSATGTSTSRSTSSPTSRASCRSCSSSSTATAAASSRRRTRTPGLNFVTRENVNRYLTTKSRFEGSSSRDRYPVR